MIYFDIETMDFFKDPWIKKLPRAHQIAAMRFGLGISFDDETNEWIEWMPGQEIAFWQSLVDKKIIGWNILGFDIPFLSAKTNQSGYEDCIYDPMYPIDLMDKIKRESSLYGKERWYSLEFIAQTNLGRGKSGDGQLACEWLRSGDPLLRKQAAEYCRLDVQLCIDIFAISNEKGLICPARNEREENGDIRIWIDRDGETRSERIS